MSTKPIDSTRDAQAAECFPPGDGIRLFAGFYRKGIWSFRSSADKPVDFLLNVDEGLLHGSQRYVTGSRRASRGNFAKTSLENAVYRAYFFALQKFGK